MKAARRGRQGRGRAGVCPRGEARQRGHGKSAWVRRGLINAMLLKMLRRRASFTLFGASYLFLCEIVCLAFLFVCLLVYVSVSAWCSLCLWLYICLCMSCLYSFLSVGSFVAPNLLIFCSFSFVRGCLFHSFLYFSVCLCSCLCYLLVSLFVGKFSCLSVSFQIGFVL